MKNTNNRLDLVTDMAFYGLITLLVALVWIPGIYLTVDNRSAVKPRRR